MVIATAPPRTLGSQSSPRLRFDEQEKPEGAWAGRRFLWLDDKPAFELSFWCGTCPFLFERLEGANGTLSLDDLSDRLAEGLRNLDDGVIETFGELLPSGEYIPLLLEVQPRFVRPSEAPDYFAREQVETWGVGTFWGLPEYPHTPYYRTFETAVDGEAHLYEFVVPMVPPSWNDAARVTALAERLTSSSQPTAVAVSTLDVCAPAVEQGPDWYWHWGLTHFLLDGHHKLQAAADHGRPLQLLALLSVEGSLASAEQLARVPGLRARSAAARVSSAAD